MTDKSERYRAQRITTGEQEPELLEARCPFCNTALMVVASSAHNRTLYDICCDDCLWQTNAGFYTVEAAKAWANSRAASPTPDGLTVEVVRDQLKEMFPRPTIRVSAIARPDEYVIAIASEDGFEVFGGPTLADCMSQVRAWKESQPQ